VSYQAFRDRADRYAASKALAWVTLEENDARKSDAEDRRRLIDAD
jgi:hypothetical protein